MRDLTIPISANGSLVPEIRLGTPTAKLRFVSYQTQHASDGDHLSGRS